jgi:hypothetical protein
MFQRLLFRIDDFATDAIAARVGAMDVSRSEAQRAQTNVIARSVDHASTTTVTDAKYQIPKLDLQK